MKNILVIIFIAAQFAGAKNFWRWDCESTSSAVSMGKPAPVYRFLGKTSLVSAGCRSGSCLQHNVVGKGGNETAGVEMDGFTHETMLDGSWIYYRWWMKIERGFGWGSFARFKAHRINSLVWTAMIHKNALWVGEESTTCGPKNSENNWKCGNYPFDFEGMAGKGWHEYIVAIKKNTGSNYNGELHLYVDGKEIGSGLKDIRHTTISGPVRDSWGGWLVKPYFQLHGTAGVDGGKIWVDDISTDDQWNSIAGNAPDPEPEPEPVPEPVVGGPQVRECDTLAPGWVWCDDFETDRLPRYLEVNDDGGDFIRQVGVGLSGSRGMRVRWQAGEDEAGNLKLVVGRTPVGAPKSLRGEEDFRELYARAYIRMQPGWTGNPFKLMRTMVFSSSDWSQAMIGHLWQGAGNKMSVDPVSCVDGSGQVTCQGYNDFNNMQWLGAATGQTDVFAASNSGKWFCIEHHVRLNEAGQSNGIEEFWIDGQLEARRDGLDFVGDYADYGLNAVFFENYWNGGSPRDQERYWDNIVVSRERIGCGVMGPHPVPDPDPEPEPSPEPEQSADTVVVMDTVEITDTVFVKELVPDPKCANIVECFRLLLEQTNQE